MMYKVYLGGKQLITYTRPHSRSNLRGSRKAQRKAGRRLKWKFLIGPERGQVSYYEALFCYWKGDGRKQECLLEEKGPRQLLIGGEGKKLGFGTMRSFHVRPGAENDAKDSDREKSWSRSKWPGIPSFDG